MPQTRSSVTVDPSKIGTVSVQITHPAGTNVSAYTTVNGDTAVTWPDEITTTTTYHLVTDGEFNVSVKANGVEVADGNGGVLRGSGGHLTVAPSLNTITEIAGALAGEAAFTGAFAPRSHSILAGYMRPQLNTGGWNNVDLNASYLLGAFRYGNGNQNDEAGWDLLLLAGTWALSLVHRKDNNRGIYSIRIDDVEVGTADGYAAAQADVVSEITGITVATTGVKRVSFKMATKNASSSMYYGGIQGFTLTRTGD